MYRVVFLPAYMFKYLETLFNQTCAKFILPIKVTLDLRELLMENTKKFS